MRIQCACCLIKVRAILKTFPYSEETLEKTLLIIAAAIGALISALLLALEPITDFAFLSLEEPGITVALLAGGAVGGGSPLLSMAIAWVVNALVYGLGAFGVLIGLRSLKVLVGPQS